MNRKFPITFSNAMFATGAGATDASRPIPRKFEPAQGEVNRRMVTVGLNRKF
jgi:hypothetical protein